MLATAKKRPSQFCICAEVEKKLSTGQTFNVKGIICMKISRSRIVKTSILQFLCSCVLVSSLANAKTCQATRLQKISRDCDNFCDSQIEVGRYIYYARYIQKPVSVKLLELKSRLNINNFDFESLCLNNDDLSCDRPMYLSNHACSL